MNAINDQIINEYKKQTFNQTPHSIIITDLEFKIISVNSTFSKLYGYTSVEVLGRKPHFLNAKQLSKNISNEIYETIAKGNVWNGTALNKKKDGSTIFCEMDIFSTF